MGKRRGGGGGGTWASATLRRHIESCKHKYPTLEELVDHLRSNYPHYSRLKLNPLTREVKRMIDLINSKEDQSSDISHRTTATSSSSMDEEHRLSKRKMKLMIDQSEEEKRQPIKKRLKSFDQKHGSVSSQSETPSSEEEENGVVSTSKIDLVKSMLRATYSASKDAVKSKRKEAVKEKCVELENVGSSKAPMQIDLLGSNSILGQVGEEEEKNIPGARDVHGIRFSDLGGMDKVVEELKWMILPIFNQHFRKMFRRMRMPSGILLHGPPGCGKTKLAEAIAFESEFTFYKRSATELVNGVSGGSEENIRDLFANAYRTAPSIVFIDEIDAIASKRDNLQREMEKRIVTQLMTSMDAAHRPVQPDAEASSSDNPPYVLVIGATNRPDSIDPALRRPGRFDHEIALGVPDEETRLQILTVVTRGSKLEDSLDLLKIARSTPGFVGADLDNLVSEAGTLAMRKLICSILIKSPEDKDWFKKSYHPKETDIVGITMTDFEEAAKKVQPSSKREGFSIIPDVKWEDVGGMEPVRDAFMSSIVERIKAPDDYKVFNVDTENGFLLYGPPGCGKTLIAKAVANEAGANFIYIKGPELLSKYVGESESKVRTLFRNARTCSPCIIFFDEVDALTTDRRREGGWVVEKLVTQLLVELDGADDRSGVYVIAATNRPEFIDPAFLRAGRLGRHLHVGLPSPEDRGLILKALARKKPIDPSVDLLEVGKDRACDNYSGADLRALVNQAAMAAKDERKVVLDLSTIHRRHFDIAFQRTSPSVSRKEIQFYNNWSGGG
ncbi:cell division control protein 48 homolog C-like [Impatiens glandulifera]|uniref:cell division control protein 48 homolog C-like n=1 Tax=Impatiens glandulifera TaxID=253017 RepID=UPI001FB10C0D|nr:cell division control protein 48 homolog C-like [Impatiens glandulifera]